VNLPCRPLLPLRTERLVLRAFAAEDLEPLLAYQSLPEVARYVPWEPRTRATAAAVLPRKVAATTLANDGDPLELAVTLAGDGTLIGEMLLFLKSTEHETGEIGYSFDPAHHGRGYATEAAQEMLRLAFDEVGLRRVTARVDARNGASQRVCERLGMRREAELVENEWCKGELTSEVDYALLQREWRVAALSRAAARAAAARR
jgi:RimJ/RimL family protein N-acetyltransferase